MIRDGSQRLTPEKEILFDLLSFRAQEGAMGIIHDNYENQPDILNNLDYHNRPHSLLMKDRVVRILRTVQNSTPHMISSHDFHLGGLAALYHDTVQNWEPQEIASNGLTILRRKRFVGQNEWDSTQYAFRFMDQINGEYGDAIYTDEDKEKVQEAIKVTIPGFDPVNGTVIQPHLLEGAYPISIALALSDLGTAGLSGGLAFQADGDALFREENLDVELALSGRSSVSDEHIRNMRERILSWTGSQVQFAKGRQQLLTYETSFLPEQARDSVQQLFSRFPESIQHAADVYERRKNMGYIELFADVGYPNPLVK